MPTLIEKPTQIEAAGNKPKIIQEFIGHVNSNTAPVSIARMRSPSGWVEPGQTPEFDEYTVVLAGSLRVESRDGVLDVGAGQAVITTRANGCATARRIRMARNTSPCACRRSPRRSCIATHEWCVALN